MNLTLICATSISRTNDVKLDELISRLRTKDMVDSVLVMGSAEEGNFRPYSDYDIAIVMRRKARPVLSSLLTTIDGHVGDVYFFYPDELSRVPRGRTVVDLSLKSSWLIGWLRSGRIAFDKSGLLTRLAAETQSVILQVPDERKYRAWYRVNYNYAHNYRMFRSCDPT